MSWSLSSLQTYEKCGFQYKLKYIEFLRGAESHAAARGTMKHKLIEMFLTGELANLPPDLDYYSQFLTGLKSQQLFIEHKVALNEKWEVVDWKSPEVWLKAVLDLKIVPEPSSAHLYDWKSGKIYDSHEDQRSLYSLTIFAEHNSVQTVRAFHVYVDLGKTREAEYRRDQMYELRKRWEDRASKLWVNPQYIPNPGYHCNWCPFSKDKGGPCRF